MARFAVAAGTVVLALGVGVAGVTGLVAGASPGGGVPQRAGTVGTTAAEGAEVGPVDARRGSSPAPTSAGTTAGTGAPGARTYVPPLGGAPLVVARAFDAPPQPWAAGHRGVDLAAHVGQAVRAPQAGVVTFAGTVVDRGVVTVTHADGLRSSLEPVVWSVRPGQRVLRGQAVGTVSATAGHCAPDPCLHWGLRHGETYLDPMRWVLDRGPIVLLPEG